VLLARVVGKVWGARQAERLQGHRLLVVRPLLAAACPSAVVAAAPDRPALAALRVDVSADHPALEESAATRVVVDELGAGPGELVLIAHGSRCRDLTLGEAVPTKDLVVAIVDGAELRFEQPLEGARP